MKRLVDIGVLLRLFDRSDPHHGSIRLALRRLRREGDLLCVAAQNAAEFWNVSTRPASVRGGYGCSISETDSRLSVLERYSELLTESPSSHAIWRKLVTDVRVRGVAVHDARLVSVMLDNGITSIVTLNPSDFQRYDDIVASTPSSILKPR